MGLESIDSHRPHAPVAAGRPLWLASTSPRRAMLLAQLGVDFTTCHVDVDESVLAGETPDAYVERVAQQKLMDGLSRLGTDANGGVVLAADTVVVVDECMLGKPVDRHDALTMLARLSGRSHRVLSCVAVGMAPAPGDAVPLARRLTSTTRVWFRETTPAERERYWSSGEPRGKAGAYAIQGLAAAFVERIEGSYTGVVGLPLYETARLLRDAGVAALV